MIRNYEKYYNMTSQDQHLRWSFVNNIASSIGYWGSFFLSIFTKKERVSLLKFQYSEQPRKPSYRISDTRSKTSFASEFAY